MRFPASLHLRLLAGTLALAAVFWLTLSITAWQAALAEAERLFDGELAETAALLASLASHEAHEMEARLPTPPHTSGMAFQIWEEGKRLALRSDVAPETRLSPIERGFSDQGDWRVYSLWDSEQHNLVQVAESHQTRLTVGRQLALHLLAPIAIALPMLALALVLLIRFSLAPLSQLADSIGSRSPERLENIPVAEAPSELVPVMDKLNSLLSRVGDSLARERRFTADAAHELRTPLAAMRAHAQVARASQAAGERDVALDRVIAAIDRTSHLIDQLLLLARVDAGEVAGHFSLCDLHRQAADVLAQEANAALAKSVSLELAEGPPVEVRCEPTLLAVSLRNLVDNAVRYSPAGGRVLVRIGAAAGQALVEVIDEGPGIAADQRQRVLDRFYRIPGSMETGAGLGLAIVARIVDTFGGKLELGESPESAGLCARVRIPLASAGPSVPGDMPGNPPGS